MISPSVRFAENTMRPLLVPVAVVMLANAPAGYAQDNPSTAGIHPAGDSGFFVPGKAVKPSVANSGVATAGIHPPGQLGVVRPGQAVVVFPGQEPIALPGYPAVTVSGSTVGQGFLRVSCRPRSPANLVWALRWSMADPRLFKWAPIGSSAMPTS
jgi:hypothetical protein